MCASERLTQRIRDCASGILLGVLAILALSTGLIAAQGASADPGVATAFRAQTPVPDLAQRLVFSRNGVAHAVNLETGEETVLSGYNGYDASLYAVSPDGEWLASWRLITGRRWQLSMISMATWQRVELGEFWAHTPTLSWSPDGKWLAFGGIPSNRRRDYNASELFVLNVETGALRRLTFNRFRDDAPDFSPDGRYLVFTSAQDGYNRLHLYDLETGERRLLTDQAFGYVPAWSPDGQRIAFSSNHETLRQQIYIINADGTGLRRVTFSTMDDLNPIWIP